MRYIEPLRLEEINTRNHIAIILWNKRTPKMMMVGESGVTMLPEFDYDLDVFSVIGVDEII